MEAYCSRVFVVVACVCLSASVAGATWSHDPLENNQVCGESGDQLSPVVVGDGAGGHVVAWADARAGALDIDIYVQRVDSSGASGWTPEGVLLCGASDNQLNPVIVSDGAGGAVVAWVDFRGGGRAP